MTECLFRRLFWDTCHGTSDNVVMKICVGAGGASFQRADVWQAQWHLLAGLWYDISPALLYTSSEAMIDFSCEHRKYFEYLNAFLWWFGRLGGKSSSGKAHWCAEHWELTTHAGINKCTGVTADHVKKHLGAVRVCIYLCRCIWIYVLQTTSSSSSQDEIHESIIYRRV